MMYYISCLAMFSGKLLKPGGSFMARSREHCSGVLESAVMGIGEGRGGNRRRVDNFGLI